MKNRGTKATAENLMFLHGLEIGADETQVPESFFLPYGRHSYTKGTKQGEFDLTLGAAENQQAEFARRGKDMVVDYEHQTLKGVEAPAAGWCDRIDLDAKVDGQRGVSYHVGSWTEKANGYLQRREYRYWSPVFVMSRKGHPVVVHSIALTNDPAINALPALVAKSNATDRAEEAEKTMDAILELLGLKALAEESENEKQVVEAITALKADEEGRTELQKQVDTFLAANGIETFDALSEKIGAMVDKSELEALKATLAETEATSAIDKLVLDGKITDAQKEAAKKSFMADKDTFLSLMAGVTKQVPTGAVKPTQQIKPGEPKGDKGIDAEQREAMKSQGYTDAEIDAAEKQAAS